MIKREETKAELPSAVTSSTAATHGVFFSTTTGDIEKIPLAPSSASKQTVSDEIAEKAIYNHLRFLRSCGLSIVKADEVARALSLPLPQVERVADKLRTRGVKVEY